MPSISIAYQDGLKRAKFVLWTIVNGSSKDTADSGRILRNRGHLRQANKGTINQFLRRFLMDVLPVTNAKSGNIPDSGLMIRFVKDRAWRCSPPSVTSCRTHAPRALAREGRTSAARRLIGCLAWWLLDKTGRVRRSRLLVVDTAAERRTSRVLRTRIRCDERFWWHRAAPAKARCGASWRWIGRLVSDKRSAHTWA